MRRVRQAICVMVVLVGIVSSAQAASVREVGLRVDLTLQPLYAGSEVHWDFDVGAYALIEFNDAWATRVSAGFDVLSAGPYLGVALLRGLGAGFALEGNLLVQWAFSSPVPVATAAAGVRVAGAADALFYELAAFPASWTLASVAGAPATFSFSPSVTVGGGLQLATGLQFGEALTLTLLHVPSLAVRPVWSIGNGWMLSTRLTTHLGYDLPGTP